MPSKIAFVFPGHGKYNFNTFKIMYETNFEFRQVFSSLLKPFSDDIKMKIISGKPSIYENESKIFQTFIVAYEVTMLKFINSKGFYPNYVAGHSIGEIAALAAAQFISYEDAVKLAFERGLSIDNNRVEGGLYALLGVSLDTVERAYIEEGINIAAINSPNQIVISGETTSIEPKILDIRAKGGKALKISNIPFHSYLMKAAAKNFKYKLDELIFSKSDIKFVSNVDSKVKRSPLSLKRALYFQMLKCIKWQDIILKFKKSGVNKIVEIGCSRILSGIIKDIDSSFEVFNIQTFEDLLELDI